MLTTASPTCEANAVYYGVPSTQKYKLALRQGRLRAFVLRPGKNGGARLASVHPSLGADSPASRVSLRNPDIPVRFPCGEGKDSRRQLPRHVRPEQLHQLLQSLHVQVREREGLCVNLATSLHRQRLCLS